MDIASLPNDPAALKELLVDKASYIAQLEEQVRLLKAILHLAKSERQAKSMSGTGIAKYLISFNNLGHEYPV